MTASFANLQSMAPHGNGLGFGPRHLDFHPAGRSSMSRWSGKTALPCLACKPDGTLTSEPLFYKSVTHRSGGKASIPARALGPIHVHPNGRFVYQTNRGSGVTEFGWP